MPPKLNREIRDLIRRMSKENPLWGALRIHGELLKLGIEVAESTVAKYMVTRQGPPSQNWRTFLRNHAEAIASHRSLRGSYYLFQVALRAGHSSSTPAGDWLSIRVTNDPTAEWIAGQVTDAFPWDEAPRHLIRDRDGAFGPAYIRRIRAMGIQITLLRLAHRGRTATLSGSSDLYVANL